MRTLVVLLALIALPAGGTEHYRDRELRCEEIKQKIRYIQAKSKGKLPIIAVGGIMSVQDALNMLDAGATLIQLYTGFIYEGPALARRINRAILKRRTR